MHLFNSIRGLLAGRPRTAAAPDIAAPDLVAPEKAPLALPIAVPVPVTGRSGSRMQLDRSLRGITVVGAHESILRRGASLKRPA